MQGRLYLAPNYEPPKTAAPPINNETVYGVFLYGLISLLLSVFSLKFKQERAAESLGIVPPRLIIPDTER